MVLVSRLGERYGTLICDLQGRRIIDLLPDRVPATLDAWLSAHPGIAIVARDRGGGYAQAVSRVRPDALQVADRWHLLENASAAFLDVVRRMMTPIRRAVGTTVVDPALLTCAERIQYDGYRGVDRRMPRSPGLPRASSESRQSAGDSDAAVKRSGRPPAAGDPTSFAVGRVPSSPSSISSTMNGAPAATMLPRIWRRVQAPAAFREACGQWASGRHAGGAAKG